MTEFTTWRSLVDGAEIFAIPDSGIFQSPLYRFSYDDVDEPDGASPFDIPETLSGLPDATADGSPIYREDQEGAAAGEYDGVDDGHDWEPDASMPTGSDAVSIAALVYWDGSGGDRPCIASWGDSNPDDNNTLFFRIRDADGGEITFETASGGFFQAEGTAAPSNEWITVGGSVDTNSGEVYLNGSEVGSDSDPDHNISNDLHTIARRVDGDDRYGGFIGDIIISDTNEPESAFQEYHDEWMAIVG